MCIINGKRVSKSTGTKDREEAERFLKKFLAPYVKDDAERTFENIKIAVASERQRAEMDEERRPQMSLDQVWEEYERSPMRRDLARTTLEEKKQVWRGFREWVHKIFPEVSELRHVQRHHCEAYLNELRHGHSSLTYNGRLCVLREMTRVLAKKALVKENPWEGFHSLRHTFVSMSANAGVPLHIVQSKIAILEGTTMLLGNGGYRFLQQVWDSGTQMMPDDAIDAMEVFLRAKGAK